jgi:hypothetical protein
MHEVCARMTAPATCILIDDDGDNRCIFCFVIALVYPFLFVSSSLLFSLPIYFLSRCHPSASLSLSFTLKHLPHFQSCLFHKRDFSFIHFLSFLLPFPSLYNRRGEGNSRFLRIITTAGWISRKVGKQGQLFRRFKRIFHLFSY